MPLSFSSAFTGVRVLVTGSTGFKGAWLSHWLQRLGAEVIGFALPPEPTQPLFGQLRLEERIDQRFGDLCDASALIALLAETRPDLVMHLAAQSLVRRSYAEPISTFETNVGGSVNLLEAIRQTPSVKALVYVTSDKCYRNNEWIWGYRENDPLGGHDPYSASKAAAEIVFAAYQHSFFASRDGFAAASVRAGNVIGGGDMAQDRIIPDCIRALTAGEAIRLRRPEAVRPWQHVLEPLAGYLQLAAHLLGGESPEASLSGGDRALLAPGAWNFGPDPDCVRPVLEMAEGVIKAWGAGRIVIDRDLQAVHEATLLTLSSDKARALLHWRPRWGFAQAVAQTVDWYRWVHTGADPIEMTDRQIKAYEEEA